MNLDKGPVSELSVKTSSLVTGKLLYMKDAFKGWQYLNFYSQIPSHPPRIMQELKDLHSALLIEESWSWTRMNLHQQKRVQEKRSRLTQTIISFIYSLIKR